METEALEDAEAGVPVTEVPRDVEMPWEAGPTVTVAVPRESVTEQEAASEQPGGDRKPEGPDRPLEGCG